MNRLGVSELEAAITMAGCSVGHVAKENGLTEDRLEAELFGGRELTEGEVRRLRHWLWDVHRVLFGSWIGFDWAVRLTWGRRGGGA
jgi:hypothetical protein